MTNAMSSGAANAGIRYRGPGTSWSGSAYWMTIAARTARVAGQRGSPRLGRADHGRFGWVLPSDGRGGGGVLGMDLLRSLAPPAAVDGRGAATGSSAQCPAPAAALGASGWWGARSGYRRAHGSWAAVLVPGGAPAASAGPGAPAAGTTPSVRIAAQRAPAWASSQSTVDPTPSTGWSASASGTVTNVTLAGSSPLSPVASSRRSTTDSPLSVVTDLVAASRKASSPVLVALRRTAAMNCCWRWMRPRSLPSPRAYRARTNASACSPSTWLTPAGRFNPLMTSTAALGRQTSTPPSALTMDWKPAKSTST